jgi:cobalt-precorrin-7 (C5)-methyltransferase
MKQNAKITVIGCGPGGKDYLTPIAKNEAEKADILIGTKGLIDIFKNAEAEKIEIGYSEDKPGPDRIVELIKSGDLKGNIAFLCEGDSGLFSYARFLRERFGRKNIRIVPGISSVQVPLARIGLEWDNVTIIKARDQTFKFSFEENHKKEKICVLVGGAALIPTVLPRGSGQDNYLICNGILFKCPLFLGLYRPF